MEFTKTENNTWVLRGNLTFESISNVIDKAKDFNWNSSIMSIPLSWLLFFIGSD